MKNIYGKQDTLNENLIVGAELVGNYGFPALRPGSYLPSEVVPFSEAMTEKNPRGMWCHCFVDDSRFERLWHDPGRYLPILRNFQGVIGPDFSQYDDMPLALQIYNVYRNRALAYYWQTNGIRVIPAVSWGGVPSYGWVFDGLPEGGTLAVSTNGCFSKSGKECYRAGMAEMERRLKPNRIICVGRPIDVAISTGIVYFPSYGQKMTERLKGGMTHGKQGGTPQEEAGQRRERVQHNWQETDEKAGS